MTRVLLAERGLTTFPDEIPLDVRVLDLGHNALSFVPESIGQLTSCDFLYLHDNQLSSLSAVPRNIRYLNLSENRFTEFPNAVCDLPQLLELRFTDNQLRSLPDVSYPRLRELHLRNNKLRTLPASIGRLQELRQLDLRGNPLETLPEELLTLPRLEKLDLRWVEMAPALDALVSRLEGGECLVYR